MESKLGHLLVTSVLLATVACATSAKSKGVLVGTAGAPVAVSQVDVYGPGQQMPEESSYAVVIEFTREVGIDSESVNKAVAGFREEAAKLGCDAVLVLSYDTSRTAKQGQSGVGTDSNFAAAGGNMNTVESRELKVVGVRWVAAAEQ